MSGAGDGSVSLWDGVTLEHLGTVHPPGNASGVPATAQFVGDTHDVTIASYDGRTFHWDTDPYLKPALRCVPHGGAQPHRGGVEAVPARPALPRRPALAVGEYPGDTL